MFELRQPVSSVTNNTNTIKQSVQQKPSYSNKESKERPDTSDSVVTSSGQRKGDSNQQSTSDKGKSQSVSKNTETESAGIKNSPNNQTNVITIVQNPVKPLKSDKKVFQRPAVAPNSTDAAVEQTNHALLIYVQDYDDRSLNLKYPQSDVERLKRVLLARYDYDESNVSILGNPGREELFNRLQVYADRMTAQDTLLIFYAGHGYWDEKLKEGYWYPRNAEKESRANWISNSDIRDIIRSIRSKHTLLVADACFSGSLLRNPAWNSNSSNGSIRQLLQIPSRKVITSGAMTTVPDKSAFVEYFVKMLESNRDPFLPTSTLYDRLQIPVINNSSTEQTPLYGVIPQTDDEGGQFIFVRRQIFNQKTPDLVSSNKADSTVPRSAQDSAQELTDSRYSASKPLISEPTHVLDLSEPVEVTRPIWSIVNESSFSLLGDIDWLRTGIVVEPNDMLSIKAFGSINLNKLGASTPDGVSGNDPNRPLTSCQSGALVARIGNTKNCIMSSSTLKLSDAGELMFTLNTNNKRNSTGLITINVIQYRRMTK